MAVCLIHCVPEKAPNVGCVSERNLGHSRATLGSGRDPRTGLKEICGTLGKLLSSLPLCSLLPTEMRVFYKFILGIKTTV